MLKTATWLSKTLKFCQIEAPTGPEAPLDTPVEPAPEPVAPQPPQAPQAPAALVKDVSAQVAEIWGKQMLVLTGRGTYEIRDKLDGKKGGLGFTWYRNGRSWVMPVERVTPEVRQALEGMGIDLSVLGGPGQMVPPPPGEIPATKGIFAGFQKSGDQFFLVLYGDTAAVRDILQYQIGMHYERGTGRFMAPMAEITPQKRATLESMGVDMSIMEEVLIPEEVAPQSAEEKVAEAATEQIESQIKTDIQPGKTFKIEDLDKALEEFATKVDEDAALPVVKDFLDFSSKFWHYSFNNQMMIWIQKRDASYVKGAKQWLEMGRRVKNFGNEIGILAPQLFVSREGQEVRKTMKPEEWNKVKNDYMVSSGFKVVGVFDVDDTEPIEGWTGPKGQQPFTPHKLKSLDPNVDLPEISNVVNAAMSWGKSKGIKIDFDKMAADLGGYSAGGLVKVNDGYLGINKFSTLVHELAHEILHQTEDYKKNQRREDTRQGREIDAETTAYIVLKHFGLESKEAPRYLALWKASSKDIKARRGNIQKSVQAIIEGINSGMSSPTTTATARWIRTILGF